jgi:threonine/homoserine/homoserine lactone efflux protein
MFFQGVLLGLSLSFMVGPLLFAIVEAGIVQGFRAGMAVALGIWASDVLYVLALMWGLERMEALVQLPGFRFWAGVSGGLLLVLFGLGSLLLKKSASQPASGPEAPPQAHKPLLRYWLRGFLLNTINPFTVFFWLGIAGAVLAPNGWGRREMLVFFGGMLGVLVLTDTLKAYAARRVRRLLTPRHTRMAQRGIGVLLLIFGAAMVLRVL